MPPNGCINSIVQCQGLLAGVNLSRLLTPESCAPRFWINHPHLVPVIGKLFAAAEAYKIRSGNRRNSGALGSGTAGYQWSAPLMATGKHPGPGEFEQLNDHNTPLSIEGPAEASIIQSSRFPELRRGHPCHASCALFLRH